MTDKQDRENEAGITGRNEMENNKPLWVAKIPIKAKIVLLDASLLKLKQLREKQDNDNKGNTTAKAKAKKDAADKAWATGQTLTGFAIDTNNSVLEEEVDFQITDLAEAKDADAKNRWQTIHDRANDNLAALTAGGYDIDAAGLLVLQGLIDAFIAIETTPRNVRVNVKATTVAINKEIKDLKAIIKGLIKLLAPFKTSDVDFYNSVTDAFTPVDIGVRHLAARITFTDSVTGVRLEGVKTEIIEKQLQKFSTVNGIADYTRQELPDGNYTLVAVLDNYAPFKNANVNIDKNKLYRLEVVLVKIVAP